MPKFTVVFLLTAGLAAAAAPLPATLAIHAQPSETSAALGYLPAGSTPSPAPGATAPAGWTPVELAGPHEGYVQNKDLMKSLDVVPGAAIRLEPRADAGVLALAAAGDKTTITGLHGKWTQIHLERKLVGYLHVAADPGGAAAPVAAAPAPPPAAAPSAPASPSRPLSPAPFVPLATGPAVAGRAAPVMALGDPGLSLPRQFQGTFVSTRSLLRPRRQYDWALDDDAGKRFAYLDVSRLLQTEQIEKYVGHRVVVYGPVHPGAGGGDIVIVVESLQLR